MLFARFYACWQLFKNAMPFSLLRQRCLVASLDLNRLAASICQPLISTSNGCRNAINYIAKLSTWKTSKSGPISAWRVQNPKSAVWILDFEVWISDFGGFQIWDWFIVFGFWFLDVAIVPKFGLCVRYTRPRRLGSDDT